MSDDQPSIRRGIPALLGVLAGIYLYASNPDAAYYALPLIVLVLVLALLLSGHAVILKSPRLALALMEPWVISAVCITALSTQLILWVTVHAAGWFTLSKTDLDAVSGALVGAITTYLATIWTDDIKKSEGPFLPASQFKKALQSRFSTHFGIIGDNLEWEACHSRTLRNGTTGWGLSARWNRARILDLYVRSRR